jgi:lipoprotein-anchoring transpeptidase ErfK/SrfK
MKTAAWALVIFLLGSGVAWSQENKVPEGFALRKIEPGDTLSKIAPREHWEIIHRVNRLDERHLPAGKEILVPAELEKAESYTPVPREVPDLKEKERSIRVFLGDQYFGAYEKGVLVFWGPVSSGRKGYETPEGNFRVSWKAKKVVSKKYNSEMPYAINFSDDGYFLHEQALPGRPASHGCVRLLKKDAMRLYEWLQKGDLVSLG